MTHISSSDENWLVLDYLSQFHKGCNSVLEGTALQGRSIPSFIEHCTHSCTGHVEVLYNSCQQCNSCNDKRKKKKTKVLQVFQLQRSRSAATFYGIQKQRHQVGSPRTEHLKIKTRVVGLYMVDIQGTRCDFQLESRPFQ